MAVTKIKNPIPIEKEIEQAIKDRLFNGFNNWNGGYDGWLEWCNTLYEPDAYYNVYGNRMALEEYKGMMGDLFEHYTIEFVMFKENSDPIGVRVVEGWELSDSPLSASTQYESKQNIGI